MEWSLDSNRSALLWNAAKKNESWSGWSALVKIRGFPLCYSTWYLQIEKENERTWFRRFFWLLSFAYEPVQNIATWIQAEKFSRNWKFDSDRESFFFWYRFFPHLVNGEGFFITVTQRSKDALSQEPKRGERFPSIPLLKEQFGGIVIRFGTRSRKLDWGGRRKYYISLNDSVLLEFPKELESTLSKSFPASWVWNILELKKLEKAKDQLESQITSGLCRYFLPSPKNLISQTGN